MKTKRKYAPGVTRAIIVSDFYSRVLGSQQDGLKYALNSAVKAELRGLPMDELRAVVHVSDEVIDVVKASWGTLGEHLVTVARAAPHITEVLDSVGPLGDKARGVVARHLTHSLSDEAVSGNLRVEAVAGLRGLFFDAFNPKSARKVAGYCEGKLNELNYADAFYAHVLGNAAANVPEVERKINYLDCLVAASNGIEGADRGVAVSAIERVWRSMDSKSLARAQLQNIYGRVGEVEGAGGERLTAMITSSRHDFIPDTMLSRASLDTGFYSNQRLLARVAARGVIDDLGGGSYRIPLLLPQLADKLEKGRDCQTKPQTEADDFIVVFKGAGVRTRHRVAFLYRGDEKYDVHKFWGGLHAEDVDWYVRVPRELRELHRKLSGENDPKVQEAARYGAGLDTFYAPAAVFRLETLPVKKLAGKGLEAVSVS